MGKRLLNLYADDDTIALARTKNINLSCLFRDILNQELYHEKPDTKEEEILQLKARNGLLASEIEKLKAENEQLKKKTQEKKEEPSKTRIIAKSL